MSISRIFVLSVTCAIIVASLQPNARAETASGIAVFAKVGNWTIIQGGGECQAAITNPQQHVLYIRQKRGEAKTTIKFTAPTGALGIAVGSYYKVRLTTSDRLLHRRSGDLYRFLTQKGPCDILYIANIESEMMKEIEASKFLAFKLDDYAGINFELDRSRDAVRLLSECVAQQ
jgi:hypothetical protein